MEKHMLKGVNKSANKTKNGRNTMSFDNFTNGWTCVCLPQSSISVRSVRLLVRMTIQSSNECKQAGILWYFILFWHVYIN